MEKPPIVNEFIVGELDHEPIMFRDINTDLLLLTGLQAQRDADVPYITKARDEGWDEGYTAARLEGDRRVKKAIEQARQETAREIFDWWQALRAKYIK